MDEIVVNAAQLVGERCDQRGKIALVCREMGPGPLNGGGSLSSWRITSGRAFVIM